MTKASPPKDGTPPSKAAQKEDLINEMLQVKITAKFDDMARTAKREAEAEAAAALAALQSPEGQGKGSPDTNNDWADYSHLKVVEGMPSDNIKEMTDLTRKIACDIRRVDKDVGIRESATEVRLKERMWVISETDRLEAERAKLLKTNNEVKETFILEVDNLVAQQQAAKAAKLYAKKQVDISLPDWFKTLEEMIKNTRATGHSNKLRWRSKACGLLKRCVLESEDDAESIESRVKMRQLALTINQYSAAQLVGHAERIKEAYIDHCKQNTSLFGKSASLMYVLLYYCSSFLFLFMVSLCLSLYLSLSLDLLLVVFIL